MNKIKVLDLFAGSGSLGLEAISRGAMFGYFYENNANVIYHLKIKMKNKSLLIEALTHKSANHEYNNEKLEFLGDRVIGLVLSNKLYDIYPKETEGVLDKRFAKLVNRKTCASIGWRHKKKDQ